MKAEIIKINEKPEFEPIQLQITIESLDELKIMWHRYNISINKFTPKGYTDEYHASGNHSIEHLYCRNDIDFELWTKLDDLLKELEK